MQRRVREDLRESRTEGIDLALDAATEGEVEDLLEVQCDVVDGLLPPDLVPGRQRG